MLVALTALMLVTNQKWARQRAEEAAMDKAMQEMMNFGESLGGD